MNKTRNKLNEYKKIRILHPTDAGCNLHYRDCVSICLQENIKKCIFVKQLQKQKISKSKKPRSPWNS